MILINEKSNLLGGSYIENPNATTNISLRNGASWNLSNANDFASKFTDNPLNNTVNNLTIGENGTLNFINSSKGMSTLTVNKDFKGNNGRIVLNTQLGDDNSSTNRLIVKGNTSGATDVIVHNTDGSGAKTIDGIEVISVAGHSEGEFKQMGRIVAGAYDYTLRRGGYTARTDNKNWYLTSLYVEPPVTPEPPVTHVLRSEIGSYASNTQAANSLFDLRLHDRLGEAQYTDALTGETKITSMWMRNIGGHNRSRLSQGQLKTQANRYVLQLGGDLAQWSTDGLNRYHVGVMAGYADQNSKTRNNLNSYYSKGKTSGYSAGFYGTWYANEVDKSGGYVDTWALYNWFDHEVDGEQLTTEKYKSRGVTASVESGYTFKVGEYTTASDTVNTFYLQPKAQITWQGIKAKNHTEIGGT